MRRTLALVALLSMVPAGGCSNSDGDMGDATGGSGDDQQGGTGAGGKGGTGAGGKVSMGTGGGAGSADDSGGSGGTRAGGAGGAAIGAGGVVGTGGAGTGGVGAGGGGAGGSAGSGTAGAGGSVVQGLACNKVVNSGQVVAQTISPAALPTASGGTIVAGTYVLTTNTVYALQSGCRQITVPAAETLVFATTSPAMGTFQTVVNGTQNGRSFEIHFSSAYTTSGGDMNGMTTCPTTTPASKIGYAATPTEVRIYSPSSLCPGAVTMTAFTKQ
jgi:hypothetical protein